MKLTPIRAFELLSGLGADGKETTMWWIDATRQALRWHVRAELEASAKGRKRRARRRKRAAS
jgi:hypothetical protein